MGLKDWLPPPPWKGPPLPNWLSNPGTWEAWTTPEELRSVEEKASTWAAHRAASMLSRADIMAGKLDTMADSMYRRMLSRLSMVPAPPTPSPAVAPPRKKRVVKKEVAVPKKLKRATTADIEELIRAASDWREKNKKFPDFTYEVREIAKEKGFELSDTQTKRIQRVLDEHKIITLGEIKPGVMEWIRVSKAPGEWPSVSEIQSYVRVEYLGFKLTDEMATKWLEEAKKEG